MSRLRVESGVSPFRVSVAGVDASGANFDQVVFDANQTPLRLWTKGYVDLDVYPAGAIGWLNYKSASSRPVTPAGTFPLFCIMYRCQKRIGPDSGPYTDGPYHRVSAGYHHYKLTQGAGGGGGVMGASALYALNMCRRDSGYISPVYVNFAIFRNYV